MTVDIRRLIAFLSACGFAASIFVYIASFSGGLVDSIFPYLIPLTLGCIALLITLYVLEYPAWKTPTFFWSGFPRGIPSWVTPFSRVLLLVFLVHLVWAMLHCGRGVPGIEDGKYVLESNGRIFKVLTRAEYLTLRAEGLRAGATVMTYLYFVPVVYWWFPPT